MSSRFLGFVLAVAMVWMPGAVSRAADEPAARNAALQYWVAFNCLPRQYSEAENQLLNNWATVTFTPEEVKLMEKWQSALVYLHRGAEIEACVWPSGLNAGRDGPGVLLPQHRARELAVIAVLRARYRFEKGRPEAGFADVLAVMRLARHVAADGGVLSLVMAEAIENLAIRCVAESFWAVNDPATLRAFVVRWDRLPKMPSTTEVLAGERDKWVSWYTTRKMDAGAETEPDLAGRPPANDPDKLLATNLYKLGLQSAAGSVKTFTTATEREFARAIEIAKLPLDKIEAAEAKRDEDLVKNAARDDKHVQQALCGQSVSAPIYKLRLRQARGETVRAMLRAAVVAKAESQDVATTSRDPSGDGPFEVTKTPTGYELRSKLDKLIPVTEPKLHQMPAPAVLAVRTVRP
jgi:hypothetical protein